MEFGERAWIFNTLSYRSAGRKKRRRRCALPAHYKVRRPFLRWRS